MKHSASIVAAILFTVSASSPLRAQVAPKRSVDVTITDQFGRSVSGLQQSNFVVREGGVQREVTAFAQLKDEVPTTVVHYRLEFDSSAPSATIEIVFNPPRGVPHLNVAWK